MLLTCSILSADNKEYDAYLSYTKVDLDSLGRSVSGFLDSSCIHNGTYFSVLTVVDLKNVHPAAARAPFRPNKKNDKDSASKNSSPHLGEEVLLKVLTSFVGT